MIETSSAAAAEAQWTPEVAILTADAVVFGDQGRRVVLVRRRDEPFAGWWALPGGGVDPGEETEEAARRELGEETGLRVGDLVPCGVFAAPGRDPRGRVVAFAYVAVVEGTPELAADDDAEAAQWVETTRALAEGLAFDHEEILRAGMRLAR